MEGHHQVDIDRLKSLAFLGCAAGLGVLDRCGYFIDVNRAFCTIYGFNREEIIGEHFTTIVPPDRQASLSSIYERFVAADKDKELSGEWVMRRKDGAPLTVRLTAALAVTETGERLTIATVEDITRKTRLQAALRANVERYRAIAEQTYDWETWFDPSGRPRWINHAVERITGHSAAECLAMPDFPLDLVYEDDRPIIRNLLHGARAGSSGNHYPFRIRHRDGTLRWGAVSWQPIIDTDGQPLGFRTSIRDITRRKLAEAALETQKAWLTTLINAVPDLIVFKDGAGRWMVANDFTVNLFGLEGVDYRGKTDAELAAISPFHHDVFLTCCRSDAQAWRAARQSCGDETVPQMDGTVSVFDVIKVPLFHEDGSRKGLVVVGRDITERKQVEEALRESEARFRTMADTAPVMIWVAGADKLCTYFNKGWLDFTGRSMNQELGEGWTEGIHRDDYRPCLDTYFAAFDAHQPFTMEYRLRRHDGTHRWVLDSGVPRFGPYGTFLGYIGSCVDITDRKHAEEHLHLAKEEAERASAAKSRFLAAASHDLRQPLQAAILLHDVLPRGAAGSRPADIHAKLGQSLRALQEMLDGLLDLSRLDAGAVEPEVRSFPLQPVVERLSGEFQPLAENAGVTLGVVPTAFVVHSDPRLLERILRNLLGNAIRYTRRGGRVLIGCRRMAGGIRLQVWDTGIGIPPEHLQSIFEEYYQVGDGAVDRRKGLGLGLSIVDRLARLLHHPIRVRSCVGRGTVFEVEIPCAPG